MKKLLYILIFTLLAVNTKAQYVQITNVAGTTAAYGSLTATVTGGGTYSMVTGGWCTYTTTEYAPGFSGFGGAPGDFKFVLNHAVSAVKVFSYAINGGSYGNGEYLELYINGVPYSFTPADITSYTDCGSGAAPCYLYTLAGGPTVIMGPLPTSTPWNGGDFIVSQCTGITSFEIYTNASLNGIGVYVYVDTVFSCFNAFNNGPICAGDSLKLSVTGGDTLVPYTWYGPGGFTTTVKDPVIPGAPITDTGKYFVVQTVGGVNDTAWTHVVIDVAPPITGTTTICVGGTTTLTDATTGGTWHSSNTAVATIVTGTGVVTGVSTGTSIITYTTPLGCIATTTVNVVVLSAISGNKVLCQGSTSLLADGAGGGAWSSTNTGVATIGVSSGLVTGVSGGTSTITYTAGGSGCYATTTVTVNPTAPITGTLSMCQHFTTTLSDALTGGTWSSSTPTVASVNSSTGVVTGVTGGTATITYTLPTGCTMNVVVTVHPQPAPPAVVPTRVCQYLTATLTVTPSPGDVLNWYGANVTPPGTNITPTPPTDSPGVIHYNITQTSAFGCVSDTTSDSVTIIAQPAPPIARDSAFCQYSPTVYLNFQVDSAAGSSLIWYTSSIGGTPLGGAPLPQNTAVTYPTPIPWWVSQKVNGCESNRVPITDTIVYKPNFTINASNTWVCDHDTLTFSYNGTAPLVSGSFQWQLPTGATIVSGAANASAISVRFDFVYGQHFVYLTVGELNGMCDSTKSVQISVIPLPSTSCYTNPNICLGDTVNLALSNESASASIFSWYIDGTPLYSSTKVNIIAANSNSGGPYSISWNDTGTHIITVKAATTQGCRSLPSYDTIEVHAIPNATFTFKPKTTGTLCLEDSVLFIANYQNYNCSYFWQPVHGFNNDNKWQIWGKVEEEQSNITLTVSDPFGCVGTSTQQIDPSACCTVLFPNAFTPNGDGHNDFFRPIFSGYHKFHSFRVVNRWGETVFESADSNPMWDGNFNGVPQDIGTYYYYIQYDCGGNTVEAKGDCTLIR